MMMTSMSSLFLCGTVFVEVWLVDVGIAEENPEPVNDPVGVVWTVDQMYFMTCKKKIYGDTEINYSESWG